MLIETQQYSEMLSNTHKISAIPIKSQQCSVKPRKLQKISAILDQQNKYSKLTCTAEDPRVNHKSLFSSIQYASSLDGA